MKKHEEEKALKDRSTLTMTTEVHRETLRCPPADRKQKTPGQMLQSAGRFSMQVADIPVNVEVVPLHPLVSLIISGIVSKVMAEEKGKKDPSKQPFQRQQPDKDKDDNNNNNNNKTNSDCNIVEINKKDTQRLSNVVSHVKWMAEQYAKR